MNRLRQQSPQVLIGALLSLIALSILALAGSIYYVSQTVRDSHHQVNQLQVRVETQQQEISRLRAQLDRMQHSR